MYRYKNVIIMQCLHSFTCSIFLLYPPYYTHVDYEKQFFKVSTAQNTCML